VRRILDRVLVPAATVAGGPAPESAAYELAAARPLAERPVIAALLAWLDALAGEPTFARCSGLLRSQFDRASHEATARAELDAWLRRHETAELGLERLAAVAPRRGCQQFAAALRAGIVRAGNWARRRLPSEWAHEFFALARDLGWPGPGADTREHQATQRWQVLLGEFGASDDVVGTVDLASAVRHLRELAGNTLFEPQEIDAALLVIDPETCIGMRFDAAWVCGLEATHWPPPASPDPFLPRDWQVRQGVPGANAELSAATASRTLERLRRDAGELILSVPGFEDEAPLLPSPLVLGFTRAAKPAGWSQPVYAAAAFASRPELERLVDGSMPAIATHDVAQGGARLVELQAACPFRASVELRLGGRELEEPAPGIDAMARGNVAHAVLKRFWDEVRNHRNLAAMTRDERLGRVHEIVTRELAPMRADTAGVLAHLLDLEQRWLEARVMELLDSDLARPPFTVTGTEMETVLEVGGMQLRLQLDRVDDLADGSVAVIDYKTGSNASPADWMGERPRSPQLPLYVRAVGEERVGAVAFGRVRTGATGYKGYVRDQKLFSELTGFIADKKPFKDYGDWGALLQAWRRRLEIIAAEYAAGDARLAPDPAYACRYCHLPGLCRIGEVHTGDPPDDDDDDVRN
jgi:probable DNA repair protein